MTLKGVKKWSTNFTQVISVIYETSFCHPIDLKQPTKVHDTIPLEYTITLTLKLKQHSA